MAKKKSSIYALLSTASVMGMHMVSGPIVGAGLGYLIDSYLDSNPYGIIIGAILGVLSGYLNVIKDTKLIKKEQENFKNQLDSEPEENSSPTEFIEYNLFGDPKKISFNDKNKSSDSNIDKVTSEILEHKNNKDK